MIHIKRILCPTDLSPHSTDAVHYALALSRAHQAELILRHCTDEVDGEYKLATSVAEYLEPSDSRWRFVVAQAQDVDEEIITQSQAANADLIVMRSRRRPHRAALLGSTAESVCRTAPCPVMVMHSDERDWVDEPDKGIQLKRVLVAYDFSDYSELALKYSLSFVQEYQAELHVLHVLPPFSLDEPEISWYPLGKEGSYHRAARRLQKAVPAEAHLWCDI